MRLAELLLIKRKAKGKRQITECIEKAVLV